MFREFGAWVGLSASEWRLVWKVLLVFFTLLIVLAIAGSFVPYEQVVRAGHPWLPFYHCPGCIFCGMTRSFCALSSGHWREAWAWNRGGPFLYAFAWLWLARAGSIFARGAKKMWQKKRAGKLSMRRAREVGNEI